MSQAGERERELRFDGKQWCLSLVPPAPKKRSLTNAESRLQHFRQKLLERELSPKTIDHYCKEVRRAEWWCDQEGYTLRTVPALVLAQYVEQRPKSWSTRKAMRSSFTRYWEVFKRKDPPVWVIRVPRKPRMVCRALTDQDAGKLALLARERGGKEGFAVLLAMYQGLRREELAAVRWADVTPDGWIKVMGKGELPATLPIHPVVLEAFEKLEREDPVWVFPGRGRGHVCDSSIWNWVRKLAADAGLEGVSTHRRRHSCLSTANDNTGDLRAVADFARHARVDTTQGYTRTTEQGLVKVVNAVSYEGEPTVAPDVELAAMLGQRPDWHFEAMDDGAFRCWREEF